MIITPACPIGPGLYEVPVETEADSQTNNRYGAADYLDAFLSVAFSFKEGT